jgi:hypothetical protein
MKTFFPLYEGYTPGSTTFTFKNIVTSNVPASFDLSMSETLSFYSYDNYDPCPSGYLYSDSTFLANPYSSFCLSMYFL